MTLVICGAGMAGIAAAYQLAVVRGIRDVVLIDEREPLSLTSDKGTQGYRNWWPGPDDTMLRFVSRSIDLLEGMADESSNTFRLNRRGYVFATADTATAGHLVETARQVSALGMGELRVQSSFADYRAAPAEGYRDQPVGADLLTDDVAHRAFPYLNDRTRCVVHVRRAGWMNATALGRWMLARALAHGASFVRDRVDRVDTTGGRVRAVTLASGSRIGCETLVLAAGPKLPDLAAVLDVKLPLLLEAHAKVTIRDPGGAMPRAAPFVIWSDPVRLAWSAAERESLSGSASTRRLLEPYPAGVHARPVDGPHGDELFLIWTYDTEPVGYDWPPRFDPNYARVCTRGLAAMIPGAAALADGPPAVVDGGFYCKTPENRPLIGPLPIEGAWVIGALSGYGIMASAAAAELLAAHVTGDALPDYARWFLPSRYVDPDYRAFVEKLGARAGQL